jgi:nucleoid-associated protein YgaU
LLSEAIQNSNSPDMTHVRMLKTSDKLIGISNRIYKNNTHYVEVARANNFDTFRNLRAGTEISFPPVSKT